MRNGIAWMAALCVAGGLAVGAGCSTGGSREVSHTESNKTGWFGGKSREVNSVYENADGSRSVETETTSTRGGTTTIVRERKTTAADGTVKTDRESRKVTAGTDNTQRETKTSRQ